VGVVELSEAMEYRPVDQEERVNGEKFRGPRIKNLTFCIKYLKNNNNKLNIELVLGRFWGNSDPKCPL